MNAATWWIDRWRKSTAYTDLPLDAQGAYRNLLDECWLRPGGVIPAEDRILQRVSGGSPEEWARVKAVVLSRFRAVEGGYVNDTALAVISQAEKYRAAKAAGGRARWGRMTEEERGAFVKFGVLARQAGENKQNKQENEQVDKQSNKPPVSGLRSPVSDSQMGSFGTLPADAGAVVEPGPKRSRLKPMIGPQDAAARRLAAALGSTINICRKQVAALVGSGWDLSRIGAAIEAHARPGVAPWDWTKRVTGQNGTAKGGAAVDRILWMADQAEEVGK